MARARLCDYVGVLAVVRSKLGEQPMQVCHNLVYMSIYGRASSSVGLAAGVPAETTSFLGSSTTTPALRTLLMASTFGPELVLIVS